MPDDAQDSLFDLKVLRSAAVEREIDEFIMAESRCSARTLIN